MHFAQITIPKIDDRYKIYVYASRNAESINTIAKVRTLMPAFIIDQSTARVESAFGKDCFVLCDRGEDYLQPGIVRNGPFINPVPTNEYEPMIDMIMLNNHTFLNQLTLNPLPLKYDGVMAYYSCIGVDEAGGTITHLSEVKGVLVEVDYKGEGTRHLYSSEDGKTWNFVAAVKWDEEIKIGDKNDLASYDRFGIPVVEKVPIFTKDEVNVSLRPIANNFVVLEIPNVWQKNNATYNYRKLKSYKVQNVLGEQYGYFSEPTYQSLMPMPIEKMVILRKEGYDIDTLTLADKDKEDVDTWEIIRNEGLYYNRKEHRPLGLNKYNIPVGERTAVFSEGSVQDEIKIQAESLPAQKYYYAIYLLDAYGNISEACEFVVRT